MNHIEYIFQIWNKLYDKDEDPKSIIEFFFHVDYIQCINGVVMHRKEYIDHVIEQKKNIKSMEFKHKKYLSQGNELFIIYNAKGKNTLEDEIEAEIIAYFELKDAKIFKIHGQVYLSKGKSSDIDMDH
ncbi:MAG: hypothetical protein H0X51_00165 [Parachlamydiaceae bacterium]|nr:hypothetical protein [Parachlamydiaceae bacterium]